MKRFIASNFAVALLVIGATSFPAPAADLYVNAAGTMPELGTQQNPFRTVQAAIAAAAAGDVIRVAAGTYTENLRIERKPLTLQGGYATTWLRDLESNPTTLRSPGGNAVINLIESDTTIDGFRITGGTGSTEEQPYGYHGGGIYSSGGSPTISNNVIFANDIRRTNEPSDYNFGGGVNITNAQNATIVNNIISGNFGGRGAGIAVVGQRAEIRRNTIADNVAIGDHGGGLWIAVVDAVVAENVIRGNEVGRALEYGWGGGLIVVGAGNFAELAFNTLTGNYAAGYGAAEFIDEGAEALIHHELIYANRSKDACETVSAIAVDGGDGVGSRATINHCTVVENVCPDSVRGNGLQVEGGSSVTVTNSIFWNNGGDDFAVFDRSTLSVIYTCSQEPIAGVGNINVDPKFVDASSRDYHLSAGSPCIDAASPTTPFAAEPGDNGGRADMGRYGNASDTPTAGSIGNGTVDTPRPSNNTNTDGSPDTNADPLDGVTTPGGALCPMASAMLMAIPLIGGRRRSVRRGT